MLTYQRAFLLFVLSATQAASVPEKKGIQQKRALDYSYPFPILSFQEPPQKFYVETIKSVSPIGQRYLPPGPTIPSFSTANGPKAPPSVSFNAFEPSEQGSAGGKPTPSSASTPASPTTTVTTSQTKKRPSGGLGSFKYYGGSGASSNNNAKTESSTPVSTPASQPSAPTPTANTIKIESAPVAAEKAKPLVKNVPYDYPSPKNNRKPSKKEQKLADSKPEESGIGYNYDLGFGSGVPSVIGGSDSAAGVFQSSSSGMGASYMRQSSPFYSFHVMLD